MPVTTSGHRAAAPSARAPAARSDRAPSRSNRALAWLATGPIGRVAAFLMDFGAAVLRALRSR